MVIQLEKMRLIVWKHGNFYRRIAACKSVYIVSLKYKYNIQRLFAIIGNGLIILPGQVPLINSDYDMQYLMVVENMKIIT